MSSRIRRLVGRTRGKETGGFTEATKRGDVSRPLRLPRMRKKVAVMFDLCFSIAILSMTLFLLLTIRTLVTGK
jgi:hypothetical protein